MSDQISNNLITLVSANSLNGLKSGNMLADMVLAILFMMMIPLMPLLLDKIRKLNFLWWKGDGSTYSIRLTGSTKYSKNGHCTRNYSDAFCAISKYMEDKCKLTSIKEFFVHTYKKKTSYVAATSTSIVLTPTIQCKIKHSDQEDPGSGIVDYDLMSDVSLQHIQEFLRAQIAEYKNRMSEELHRKQRYFCPEIDEDRLRWKTYPFETSKTMENIFFPEKEEMLQRLDHFTHNKELYQKQGIPWTLGILLWGDPGTGKCLGRDTPILMYNGTVKLVQDVEIGDVLMGDNSTPRHVLSLARGREKMYRIVPTKGEPYIVNESHILSLKRSHLKCLQKRNEAGRCGYRASWCDRYGKDRSKSFNFKNYATVEETKKSAQTLMDSLDDGRDVVIDISVRDYLKKSKIWKHKWKGHRAGVDFENGEDRPGAMAPYLLGVWLGDGTTVEPAITNTDTEILEYLAIVAEEMNLKMVKRGKYTYYLAGKEYRKNLFRQELRENGLLGNKHIPLKYKTGSRKCRLEVLAGLLDTDGYHNQGHFDIIQKKKKLAEDIVYLARSCGLAAYMYECKKGCMYKGKYREGTYYRMSISGHTTMIPTKVRRKQATPRKMNKSVLNVGIAVEPLEIDEYFGFQIDGNRRFLLGDFTVTHNTSYVKALAKYTNRHIIEVPLGRIKTYGALREVMLGEEIAGYRVPFEKRLYLMEDIDCLDDLVLSRKKKEEEKKKKEKEKEKKKWYDLSGGTSTTCFSSNDTLTLSHLLNIIDGPLETPGRILIMTSNHPEKLDEALTRDGRMDIKLEMKPLYGDYLQEMVWSFFPEKSTKDAKLYPPLLNSKGLTPATIQNLCFTRSFEDVCSALR